MTHVQRRCVCMVLAGLGLMLVSSATPFATMAGDLPEGAQPLIDLAVADAAAQLGLDPSDVGVVSVQPVDWPDASLGCPSPDVAYAQVITPGWLIVLDAAGTPLEYHTDRTSRVVRCDTGAPVTI